jgi:hypothetical protein
VRAVLLDRALADAATGGGHDDVESAECCHCLGEHLLGSVEVGDVHLVEGRADRIGYFLALRLWPVEDGDGRTALCE